jgi:hypothetical protein
MKSYRLSPSVGFPRVWAFPECGLSPSVGFPRVWAFSECEPSCECGLSPSVGFPRVRALTERYTGQLVAHSLSILTSNALNKLHSGVASSFLILDKPLTYLPDLLLFCAMF